MNKKQKMKESERLEIEKALKTIYENGETLMCYIEDEINFGWTEQNVGDFVYFRTYDDDNDNVTVSKGEIIEIITSDKKVPNRPNEKGDKLVSEGWHNERSIRYKIKWNGMTSTVDSRYVYKDELKAVIAAISGTIKNYLKK